MNRKKIYINFYRSGRFDMSNKALKRGILNSKKTSHVWMRITGDSNGIAILTGDNFDEVKQDAHSIIDYLNTLDGMHITLSNY